MIGAKSHLDIIFNDLDKWKTSAYQRTSLIFTKIINNKNLGLQTFQIVIDRL